MRQILALLSLLWLLIAGVWVGYVVVEQAKAFPTMGSPGERLGAAAGAAITWPFLASVWCLPPIAMAAVSLALSVFDDKPKTKA